MKLQRKATTRILTAAGVSALSAGLLATTGCSRESDQQSPVTSQSEAGRSKAPASGQEADARGMALVRVVNAAPGVDTVDVMAAQQTAFSQVDYGSITPYRAIPADADDFAVKARGDATTPAEEDSEAIMGGRHYTLVVFPDLADEAKVSLDVISDDLEAPSNGKARVRVINAAAGTDDIAIAMRGQGDGDLFDDVDFKEAVAYKEVDPVNAVIELRQEEDPLAVNPKTGDKTGGAARDRDGSLPPTAATGEPVTDRQADRTARADRARPAHGAGDGEVLATDTLNLEAGKSYTIVIAGRANGDRTKIETLVVEDTVPAPAATN